jgi:hypothetical protein
VERIDLERHLERRDVVSAQQLILRLTVAAVTQPSHTCAGPLGKAPRIALSSRQLILE